MVMRAVMIKAMAAPLKAWGTRLSESIRSRMTEKRIKTRRKPADTDNE